MTYGYEKFDQAQRLLNGRLVFAGAKRDKEKLLGVTLGVTHKIHTHIV
jgi:hypothetical protein